MSASLPRAPEPDSKRARLMSQLTRTESVAKIPGSSNTSSRKPVQAPSVKVISDGAPVLEVKKMEEETPAAATTTSSSPEETTTPTPAVAASGKSRDPLGHKHIAMADIIAAIRKTRYLPLADGQFTGDVYFQPFQVLRADDKWCDVDVLELFFGSNFKTSHHCYMVDTEDLLKMLYLYQMLINDNAGAKRLTFDQWIVSVYQEMLQEDPKADYSKRGELAKFKLDHCGTFAIGDADTHLAVYFQKRCIRDLEFGEDGTDADIKCYDDLDNSNIVRGKTPRGKMEYQIVSYIFSRAAIDVDGEELC